MKQQGLLLVGIFISFQAITKADEGMWLPYLMPAEKIEAMQNLGLSMPFDSIYHAECPSLKDAIVSLDDGSCTGEFISSEGLLLTNHHCAYDDIQSHSSLNQDYLTNGFWAKSRIDELPNPGKTATILIDARDMTPRFLSALNDTLEESVRASIVDSLTMMLVDSVVQATGYEASVKPFFNGNRFFLFVTETFHDVRLVGAPPSSIGKFGGDTDNWVWPRHTGDFALYRVYCAPDGQAAEYAVENVPFTPKRHLAISLAGVKEDDFTLVMGYPGETNRYTTSFGLEQIRDVTNPLIEEIRGVKQAIWKAEMAVNPRVSIQYAAKYSNSSNYWKYSIGQNEGLKRLHVIDKKKSLETDFTTWVKEDSMRQETYAKTLPLMQAAYLLSKELSKSEIITIESILAGPDLLLFALTVSSDLFNLNGLNVNSSDYKLIVESIKDQARAFYKDYDEKLDESVFAALLEYYMNEVPESHRPSQEDLFPKQFKGNYKDYAQKLYATTVFKDSLTLYQYLNSNNLKKLNEDPLLQFSEGILEHYFQLSGILEQFEQQIDKNMRQYVTGLFAMYPTRDFYPDANSTFRLSYGKVGSYEPRDGVVYDYKTTLQGMLDKASTGQDDFFVQNQLKEFFKTNDFGRYGNSEKELQLCFLTDNDITGGNSGSPVLNKTGDLIGVAFDGNWEAMTGDLAFEPELQKTICVDIRYVLFVIDKYASAGHLIDEMTILD